MNQSSILKNRSFHFAVMIVKLSQFIQEKKARRSFAKEKNMKSISYYINHIVEQSVLSFYHSVLSF
jgi:hypothetical protein